MRTPFQIAEIRSKAPESNRGRGQKVALSPPTIAGEHDPLSGLLFSPCAAFIWNHDRGAVAWMNSAARAKFKLGVHELSAAFSNAVIQRLTAFFDPSKRRRRAHLKIKVAGVSQSFSTVAPLKLAGGDNGLIIAEVPEGEGVAAKARQSSSSPVKPVTKSEKPAKQTATGPAMALPPPAQKLTAQEWQAFKAIGRKVRKLCREKLQGQATSAPAEHGHALRTPACCEPKPPQAAGLPDGVKTLLPAFDLFLLLDADLRISKVEGRTQRAGWRKASLQGRPIAELFSGAGRTCLKRMVSRIETDGAQISRDALAARNEAGEQWACRVTLGRWPHEGAAFFLAMISLEMPQRLKRLDISDIAPRAKRPLAA